MTLQYSLIDEVSYFVIFIARETKFLLRLPDDVAGIGEMTFIRIKNLRASQ